MSLGSDPLVGANLLARVHSRHSSIGCTDASRTSSLLPIQRRQEEQCEYFKINPDLMPEVKK